MKRTAIPYCLLASLFCTVLCALPLSAADKSLIRYEGTDSYTLFERTDLRRYDNGKYTGLLSRESRAFISPEKEDSGLRRYAGQFFVLEQTKSNLKKTAKGIDAVIPVEFSIDADGEMTVSSDSGYPSYRSFPSFPETALSVGDSWTAPAVRCVDPLNSKRFTRIPMLVQYVFQGEEEYRGEAVYRVRAQWATRYGSVTGGSFDPEGDSDLSRATGSHTADIIVRKATGEAVFIRDTMDETFVYADGATVGFKGTTLLFTQYPPALNRSKILPALNRIAVIGGAAVSQEVIGTGGAEHTQAAAEAGEQGEARLSGRPTRQDIQVAETDAGLRLSLQNIRFQPDSAEILPEESGRLDEIAAVLRLVEGAQFLVEGHTASTGKPEGEKKLSIERAEAIANALIARGIDAGRFMCTGYGGTRPVADNASAAGRAQNRRVEITILEK